MIFYFHGFNTGAAGTKAQQVDTYFHKKFSVFRYDQPYQPVKAIAFLREKVSSKVLDNPRPLLIGSSLGGFYALHLAQEFNAVVVLINPSIQPFVTLQQAVGNWTNYVTQENYDWTREDCNSLSSLRVEPEDFSQPLLMLLDKEDEVLNYKEAIDAFGHKAEVRVFENGHHQFPHMVEALPMIDKFYKKHLN
ncbi:MAG: YqiA/YcfP family alpha/beta fold hydrolase [Pseudomonadota bacterium]